jgi:hypothetical protein
LETILQIIKAVIDNLFFLVIIILIFLLSLPYLDLLPGRSPHRPTIREMVRDLLNRGPQPAKVEYDLSVAHPKKLPKGRSSGFYVSIHHRSVSAPLDKLVLDTKSGEYARLDQNAGLITGQRIKVSFFSHEIDFEPAKTFPIPLEGKQVSFQGKPKESSHLYDAPVTLSILDPEIGDDLILAIEFRVRITDYILKVIPRPVAMNFMAVTTFIVGLFSTAMGWFETIDKTVGLAGGSAFMLVGAVWFGSMNWFQHLQVIRAAQMGADKIS